MRRRTVVVLLGIVGMALAGWGPAGKRRPETPGSGRTVEVSAARRYFTDVLLTNQYGQKMRLYSDLLEGKVVVIHSFYRTCGSVCPVILQNMARIQDALGDRVGKDVHLISITVDPEADTPERLREMSEKLHARPGWFFLSGPKQNVDWALYKLGFYVEARDDHSTLIIVGNEPKGYWKKVLGFVDAAELIRIVRGVMEVS